MKTFYFKNRMQTTMHEKSNYAEWLDENTSRWEWYYPFESGSGRWKSPIGVTIYNSDDCLAFALRFRCYKIEWNGLNVIADDALTTE